MQVFLTIVVLVALTLLATQRSVYRLRRSRVATALLSGGWIPLGIGIGLGPAGAGLITVENVQAGQPLLVAALGWIGFAVGLQVRREVLSATPARVARVVGLDLVTTGVVLGGLSWLALSRWGDAGEAGAIASLTGLLIAASLGWSPETRSLGGGRGEADLAAAGAVRGGGSLAIIAALVVAGLLGRVGTDRPGGAAAWLDIAFGLGLALLMGLLGKYALSLAGTKRDQQLIVFLGLVAFTAGVATQVAVTPMFASMLTAAVIANLRGERLRWFERFIYQGEPVIAAFVALAAGLLLDVRLGAPALVLAGLLFAGRLAVKPWAVAAAGGWRATPYLAGPLRQGPLALALGLGLVMEQPSVFARQLLGALALVGIATEAAALVASTALGGRRRAEPSGGGA